LLKTVIDKETPNVVLLGKQSIDGDCAQTGPMLAALLKWPQATFACKIDVSADKKTFTVERETDSGSQVIEVNAPAVITADLRLNEPR
jgi:electron transfer flavoprotein beta subunit